MKERYWGVYVKDDEEMFLVNDSEIFKFLAERIRDFEYNFYREGDDLFFYHYEAGEAPNKVGDMSIGEYLDTFEEYGYYIKPISEWEETK